MNKNALFKISYGLYVLTSKDGDKHSGCIINTAMQISETPLRVCISINKANYTHDLVMKSKKFNISALSQEADFAVLSPPVRRDNVRKTNARIIIIISSYPLFLALLKKPKQILE